MRLKCVAVSVIVLAGYVAPTAAQTRGGENELLQEVRLLREEVQALASTNARVQIAFGRFQLQEQRVAKSAGRLDEARSAVAKVAGQVSRLNDQLQRYESTDLTGLDPKVRERLPATIRELKSELQQLETERLRLVTLERELARQLALDQNMWAELNLSLDELERSLTQPQEAIAGSEACLTREKKP